MSNSVCPHCGCSETVTHSFRHDQGFLEETWTECKQCRKLQHHYSYGCTFVADWQSTEPPDLIEEYQNSDTGVDTEDLPF